MTDKDKPSETTPESILNPCTGLHCGGKNEQDAPHTCPFKKEINDDHETLCHCCSNCTHECAMDI